jgi:terminase large subunit-like protein
MLMRRHDGLSTKADKATFSDGTYGFEVGINAMLERIQTGRLKIFGHLEQWFEEFRTYYRKDGVVVKEHDDLLSATRVALWSGTVALASGRVEVGWRSPI